MVTKYGLTTWDDADHNVARGGRQDTKDLFLKLDSGTNVVRVLTKPYQYTVHKGFKLNANDRGFGMRVPCSAFDGEKCPLCEAGLKTQVRWYLGVIDRKTSSYKVLDVGGLVMNQLSTYNKDVDWGNPETYDIDIKVDKKGGATGYYSVVPKPKKALSEADLVIKAKVQSEYAEILVERCKPPTREGVEKYINAIKKKAAQNASTQAESSEDESNNYNFEEPSA